jgi:hypothetical protein
MSAKGDMTKIARKSATPFEPVRRSVYVGRIMLGRYVQTDEKHFEAFVANGRSLGNFPSMKATLEAISGEHDRLDGSGV